MWFSSLILSLRLLFQDQSLIVNDSWCISGEVFDISNVITLKKIQLNWLSICIYDNPNLNFSAKIQIFNFLKAFLARKFKLRTWQMLFKSFLIYFQVKIWIFSAKIQITELANFCQNLVFIAKIQIFCLLFIAKFKLLISQLFFKSS